MSGTLVKNSTIYGLGTILARSLGIVLIPIYTNYLTVEEYGTLALLNLMLQLGSFVCLLGISTASMRLYYEPDADDETRRALYGNATLLLLAMSPIVIAISALPVYFLVENFLASVPFFPFVAITLCTSLFTPIIMLMLGLLRVKNRAKTFILFNISFFLFQTLLIIIMLTWFNLGLVGLVYSQLAANIIFWGLAVIILAKNSTFRFSAKVAKGLLYFGIPLVPAFIFMWTSNAAGRFMLERYVSLQQVGIFSLAAQFSGIMLLLSSAFNNALQPYFFENADKDDAPGKMGTLITRYIALFGILGLALAVLSPPLILLIANDAYYESIYYVTPIVLASWIYIASIPVNWCLTHRKKGGTLSFVRGTTTALLIALLYLFLVVFEYGLMGVIYAMILANCCTILIGYLISQRYLTIRFSVKRLVYIIVPLLASGTLIYIPPGATYTSGKFGLDCLLLAITTLIVYRTARLPDILSLIRLRRK